MPKIVLIAIDWSQFAEKAFDWYVYHLHRKGTRVVLTHYIEAKKEKELMRKEEELMELRDVYGERLRQLKIDHNWVSGTGSTPADHIIQTGEDVRADMIVMGARGLGKIKRAILGSVSDGVIRRAKVPVLICKWEKD